MIEREQTKLIAVFLLVVSVPVTKDLVEELAIIVLLVTMALVMAVVKVGCCTYYLCYCCRQTASYFEDIELCEL